MSTSSRVDDLRNQLMAHQYATSAGEFVRYRSDPEDDALAGIVRSVTGEGAERCEEFRQSLGEEETTTLRLFAMRRTLQGRRNASLSLLSDAMDAYALLPTSEDVPWDSWFKGTLFVARSLGLNIETLGERFTEVASPRAIERSDVAMEAMSRVDALAQCQLIEVTTTYGTGFIELLVFSLTAKSGWMGTRRLAVNEIEFQPTTNLAQVAASFADALDASGTLIADSIGQDQLAATTFSLTVPGSYIPTAGCLSFNAEGVDGEPSFSVFVAELPENADVASLAAAATDLGGQAAIYDSSRLIVMSVQPSFDDEIGADEGVETDVDFHGYERLALTALTEPTNSRWPTS